MFAVGGFSIFFHKTASQSTENAPSPVSLQIFYYPMSFLRKIRRRHKAFLLKRSEQTNRNEVNGALSVSSLEGGDEEDDDDDSPLTAGQRGEETSHLFLLAPPNDRVPAVIDFGQERNLSAQSAVCIPSSSKKGGISEVGRENRFWPWIAKTAVFMLMSLGASYIGKVGALGITLCLVVACKMSAKDPFGDNCMRSSCAESGQGSCDDDSTPLIREREHQDGQRVAFCDDALVHNFHVYLNNDAEKDTERNYHNQSEEVLNSIPDGDTDLHAKRKLLKRLNCIKLQPSAFPSGDFMEQSPSANASPRTWFRNAGCSMVPGSSNDESPAGIRKHRFKSKILFRHLRKGEPESVPSSPLWSDAEAIPGCYVVPDGSDSERPIQRAHVRPKSKFKPVFPVSVADAKTWLQLNEEKAECSCSDKQERMQIPGVLDTSSMKENGKADVCPAVICKMSVKEHNVSNPLPENGQSHDYINLTATPTSGEAMIMAHLTDQRLQPRKKGTQQYSSKHVSAPVAVQMSPMSGRGNSALERDRDFLQPARIKSGERKQQGAKVGTAWLTSGLAIVTAGLLMGRILAVTGVVFYWYALSLLKKLKKASANT